MHRLSGPVFWGINVDFTCALRLPCTSPLTPVSSARFWTDSELHWKISAGYYRSYKPRSGAVPDDTAKLEMYTLQVGAERDPLHQRQIPLRVGGGLTVHYFTGKADSFFNLSIPVWAYLRAPKWHLGPFSLKGGVRGRLFLPFGDSAFKPFEFEKMKRNKLELISTFFAGFEFRR